MIKFEKVSLETFKKSLKVNDLTWADFENKSIEEIYESIQLPTRSTKHSAGYDFKMPYKVNLPSCKSITIPTGIKAYMNDNNVLVICPRSSLGIKKGFKLNNTLGIIDSDYVDNEDNEGQILINFSTFDGVWLDKGDKFVQGIFLNFDVATDEDEIVNTRKGGIGSTK